MVQAANSVTYNMPNDDESFNIDTETHNLEWNVMQSPNKTGVVLLANRVVIVCGFHIG
jgi:hypothetical protein